LDPTLGCSWIFEVEPRFAIDRALPGTNANDINLLEIEIAGVLTLLKIECGCVKLPLNPNHLLEMA
jgi:hypothetical protein